MKTVSFTIPDDIYNVFKELQQQWNLKNVAEVIEVCALKALDEDKIDIKQTKNLKDRLFSKNGYTPQKEVEDFFANTGLSI